MGRGGVVVVVVVGESQGLTAAGEVSRRNVSVSAILGQVVGGPLRKENRGVLAVFFHSMNKNNNCLL